MKTGTNRINVLFEEIGWNEGFASNGGTTQFNVAISDVDEAMLFETFFAKVMVTRFESNESFSALFFHADRTRPKPFLENLFDAESIVLENVVQDLFWMDIV